jgi:glyoxylase-like metal-dependent hydrolase (beta-lactamase superfamily II)
MAADGALERLTGDVWVLASAFVQSKRGLIVDEGGATLIDTSLIVAESEMMIAAAHAAGRPARRIVLTHSHYDHSAGCQLLPQAERIAQRGAGEWMLTAHARGYLERDPPEHPDVKRIVITLPTLEIDGPAVLRLAAHRLTLLPTPGHSPDSMSVLVEPEGVLFAGDAVITCFPPVIEDGDSRQALESYRRIQGLAFDWLVPGHGPVLERAAADRHIEISRAYLAALRDRIDRLDDPGTPLAEVEAATAGLTAPLPPDLSMVAHWHARATAKVWAERRAALQAGAA